MPNNSGRGLCLDHGSQRPCSCSSPSDSGSTSSFGQFNKTYGTIGAVIVVLLWFYLSSLVWLVGAELNSAIEHASPYGKAEGEKDARRTSSMALPRAKARRQRRDSQSHTRPRSVRSSILPFSVRLPPTAANLRRLRRQPSRGAFDLHRAEKTHPRLRPKPSWPPQGRLEPLEHAVRNPHQNGTCPLAVTSDAKRDVSNSLCRAARRRSPARRFCTHGWRETARNRRWRDGHDESPSTDGCAPQFATPPNRSALNDVN
jgi:hypothetical protein